jgi:hypothetical protein
VHRYTTDLATPIWQSSFGSTGDDTFSSFTVSPDGSIVVVGQCKGDGFAGQATPCKTMTGSGYIARIAP